MVIQTVHRTNDMYLDKYGVLEDNLPRDIGHNFNPANNVELMEEDFLWDAVMTAHHKSGIASIINILLNVNWVIIEDKTCSLPCLNCLFYGWDNNRNGRCEGCVGETFNIVIFFDLFQIFRPGTWSWGEEEVDKEVDYEEEIIIPNDYYENS